MLKNSLSSFIVTILATILSFFVSVLLSHKLNVVDFGIVQFYLSSVLFMSVISRLGFDLIFIKYWKEYDSFKKQDLIFITSIVILLLSILFSLLFFFYYKLDISIGVIIFLLIFISSLNSIVSSYFKAAGEIIRGVYLDSFLNRLVFTFILCVIYYYSEINIEDILLFNLVSYLVPFLYYIYQLRKRCNFKIIKYISLKKSKHYLWLGAILSVIGISQSYLKFIDIFYIERLLSPKYISIYTIAMRFNLMLFMINSVVISIVTPKISELYKKNKIQNINLDCSVMTYFVFSIISFSLLGFYFFGDFLISFFGYETSEIFHVTIVLMIFSAVNMLLGISGVILSIIGQHKFVLYVMLIFVLLSTLLYPVFINNFGFYGAVYLTGFISVFWKAILSLYLYYKFKIHSFCSPITCIRYLNEKK
ncbi:hypothetical protein C0W96_12860 [Photobacterium kishitanii]|uniref:oligosaccharide flippase family protein n=3 Tax=Photobacterium kishitanii TaxID=318456 RepID=UPI0005D316BC|nr:oligosaccharide flippase family protein [Photobacterium kishitanii]KJG09233.1 hypothetical protein UB40_13845 [Photobacterium kishitanii]PSV05548.1 hypothetical protein C0W96_12860 [Photobacterium kishitanii]